MSSSYGRNYPRRRAVTRKGDAVTTNPLGSAFGRPGKLQASGHKRQVEDPVANKGGWLSRIKDGLGRLIRS